ncbi:MAG: class E sortase [Propionibacteriaceae bacterium]|nr:class E sortase [Propionibacteriaceae bacterium]
MTSSPIPVAPRKATPRRPRKAWGWLVMVIVVILLVGGVVGALLVSNAVAASRYADEVSSSDATWISVERLGGEKVPVVTGTSLSDLRHGVGWYASTASPGQVGNFALAGHRLGWGQPFAELGAMRVGDQIEVTHGATTYTYTVVTGPTVVSARETDVLAAVPGGVGRVPTKAMITLTTAASLLPSPDRLVVVGELTATQG